MGRGAERRGVGRRTRRMPGGGRKKARQAKSLSGQRNKKGLFSSPNLVPPNKNARRDTAGVSVWWKIGDSPAAYPTVRRTVGCALRCAGLFSSPNLVPPNKNTRRDTAGVSVWWSVLSSIRTCFYRAKSREYHDIAELLHAVCRQGGFASKSHKFCSPFYCNNHLARRRTSCSIIAKRLAGRL